MFTSIRRLASAAAVLAAVGGVVATAGPASAVPDYATTFFGVAADGTAVVALDATGTETEATWQTYDLACRTDVSVSIGLEDQIGRYRELPLGSCQRALYICANQAQEDGRLAGVVFAGDHFRCWSHSKNVTSMDWRDSAPSTVAPPRASDAEFLVMDADAAPQPTLTTSVSVLAPVPTSVRMSGSMFVSSSVIDKTAAPSQSHLLTYLDWFGHEQLSWAQLRDDGGYNFLTVPASQGRFLNGRILDPTYCQALKLCHLTNAIQFRGADGHRYIASLN